MKHVITIGNYEFEVPENFTVVKWNNVYNGKTVYTVGTHDGKAGVNGPFKVQDKEKKVLLNTFNNRTFLEPVESLLVRIEPI